MLKNAVNVFVPPVGADTKMFFLSCMGITPCSCGRLNPLNWEKNHSLTNGCMIASTSFGFLSFAKFSFVSFMIIKNKKHLIRFCLIYSLSYPQIYISDIQLCQN